MRRTHILGGVAAVLIAGAGVSLFDGDRGDVATRSDASSIDGVSVGAGASTGGVAADRSASSDAYTAAPSAKEALAAPSGPRIVKTASLTVSVDKADLVRGAAQKANTIAERHGGYVSATETSTGEDAASSLTLRVPVAAYDAALGELRGLGDVSNESLGGNDVTATLVEFDARLRSLRAQETALNALMGKATTVGETLQVAQAVAEVRTQIEQLAGQQKSLTDQADFATVSLRVVGPGGAVNVAPSSDPLLAKAFERALGGALDVVGGAIVVIGYALPAGLIVALGYGLWRLGNRRRPTTA